MNREWITLAFGILLVAAIAAVSVWQNSPFGRSEGTPAVPVAGTPPPAAPAAAPGGAGTPRTADPGTATQPAEPSAPARLDATVPVVHKHRFGSCEGTLRAAQGTITYTTSNRDDGFRLAIGEIDEFELDDDRRGLRVRKRGGRTWNFEPRGTNPASLIAFHREVERVRRGTR
jgi:hypothetical protein